MNKKLKTNLIFIFFWLLSINVQSQIIEKNNSLIKAGYGIGSYSYLFINVDITNEEKFYDNFEHKSTGSFYLKYEYILMHNLSINLNFAYIKHFASNNYTLFTYNKTTDQVKYLYPKETLEYETFDIIIRVNHIFISDKRFNIYFGYGLGVRAWNINYNNEYTNDDPNIQKIATNKIKLNELARNSIALELTVGARYMFNNSLGIYSEYGLSKSIIQAGVMIKF